MGLAHESAQAALLRSVAASIPTAFGVGLREQIVLHLPPPIVASVVLLWLKNNREGLPETTGVMPAVRLVDVKQMVLATCPRINFGEFWWWRCRMW